MEQALLDEENDEEPLFEEDLPETQKPHSDWRESGR